MSSPTLDAPDVASLVADAVMAPALQSAQPWLVRHVRDGDTLELRTESSRALPHDDPAHRELRLECGAALFNLRVAAAHGGRGTRTDLLPDPGDPGLLAVTTLRPPGTARADLAALYPAVRRRHGADHPFTGEQIPAALLDELRGAAAAEGARLAFPDARHAQALLDLAEDAEAPEASRTDVHRQVARWARTHTDTVSGGGVPSAAPGAGPHGGGAPVGDFLGAGPPPGCATAAFEEAPFVAVLGTREDGPLDWLRAGQAMERVLLAAALDGLAMSLEPPALRWPQLRWALRDPLAGMGYVQMLLRLGYGAQEPAAPPRPVSEVLSVV
ncbi:nitroreductase [Streptomyces sulfonofaciens]|uniref:Nitroreductase n=1 Tax=Streptomyces sulfonofaciens TaxID=68272 RepID=A0A919L5I3_9ACTN|nr:nitroreductase [Streptomyces sulfonofaciens]GHH83426.1 nitroreductase [Streptomyces sulfonofaciens]